MTNSPRDPSLTAGLDALTSRVSQFEEDWEAGSPPSIAECLASLGDLSGECRQRQALLRELVAIDLECRWKHSGSLETLTRAHDDSALPPAGSEIPCKPLLEDYRSRFPELGSQEALPVELIAREYRVRHRWGDRPAHAEYSMRFSAQDPTLRDELFKVDRELAADRDAASGMPASITSRVAPSIPPGFDLPAIPEYEVLSVLGKGGMGVVLKARHRVLGRLVAIKLPLAGQLADAAERERFLREARAAARLHHPYICPIHEVGEVEGRPYLALHFVAGQTLRDWSAEHKPTARNAAEFIARVARAVGYAHQHGVVHRDLKPANVMVDAETGQPVLMDFGLAKELDEDASLLTQTGQVLGTPAYMAPEQAAGRLHEVGPLSDIYSLGAILYELVCSRRPFEGGAGEVLRQLQTDEPPPPRKLNPRLHRDLETVCLKALAKDPATRYATAEALADDLERFASGEAILARPEPAWRKGARRVQRNAGLAAALLLLAVAVTAGGYFALTARNASRRSDLKTRLDEGLQGHEWSAERLRELDDMVARLTRLDPGLGAEVAGQIPKRMTADILSRIEHRGRMSDEDQMRIEGEIRLLEDRDARRAEELRGKLAARMAQWHTVFELPGDAGTLKRLFDPAQVKQTGKTLRAAPAYDSAGRPRVLTRLSAAGPAQLDVTFDASWETATQAGLLLSAGPQQSYAFVLLAPDDRTERERQKPDSRPPTVADARRKGKDLVLEIQRNGIRLRGETVASGSVPGGPLTMRAKRQGDTLTVKVNDRPELKFVDLFPLRAVEGDAFGVIWPAGVGIVRLSAEHQTLPSSPSPLEQGDELFSRGEWEAARQFYDEQSQTDVADELQREAAYKAAQCLLQEKKETDALTRFEALQQAGGGNQKWPLRAACQIWLIRLKHKEFDKANAALDTILSAFSVADEFALVLSEDDRLAAMNAYMLTGVEHLSAGPDAIDRLERSDTVLRLVGGDLVFRVYAHVDMIQMLGKQRDFVQGMEKAEAFLKEIPLGCNFDAQFLEQYGMLARAAGDVKGPLQHVDRLLYKRAGVYRSEYYLGLLVERARLHAAQGESVAAEADLDELDRARREVPDPHGRLPRFVAEAGLVRGFLRERRGDAAGAAAAWRAAMAELKAAPPFEHVDMNPYSVLTRTILASLTDTPLSDQEVEMCLRALRSTLKGGSAALDAILDNEALLRGFVPREALAGDLSGMWRSSIRGRSMARDIALRTRSHYDISREAILLALSEHVRREAFADATTPELDALAWNASEHITDALLKRGIGRLAMACLASAWTTGAIGAFGWQDASGALKERPELRGLLAYVLGQRFLRQGWRNSDKLFRDALADATPGSKLAQLAQFELEHPELRKELAQLAAEGRRFAGDATSAEAAALRGRLVGFWRQHRDTPLGPAAFRLASAGVAWPADLLQRDRIPPEVLAAAGLGDPLRAPETLVAVPGGEQPAGHWDPIWALAVSPDGTRLATGSGDGTIKVWSVPDGKPLRTLVGHVAAVVSLDFSPDGQLLASGSDDVTCRVWSVTDGAEKSVLRGHTARVSTLAFDADGKRLVSGGWDGAAKVWDLTSGLEQHMLLDGISPVHAVARVDENRLAVAHENGEVRLWNLSDDRLVRRWTAHVGQARALTFNDNGRQLVSGGADSKLKVWNLAEIDGEPRTIEAVYAPYLVAFTSDGRMLVTAGADGVARRFDLATGEAQPPLTAKSYFAAAFDVRRNVLVAASLHNQVEQLDLATGQLRPLVAGRAAALAVAWSPDGATLATAYADGLIRLWNVATGQPARTLVEQGAGAFSLVFQPNGRLVAAGLADGKIATWDTTVNEPPREWAGHKAVISRVAFHPDGQRLASAAHDGTVKLWMTADGTPSGECKGHQAAVTAVAFCPDGRTLATGSWDKTLRLWDTAGVEVWPDLEQSDSGIIDLSFEPFGRQLAVIDGSGAMKIWTLADRKIQATYPSSSNRSMTFAPDGHSLAVAGIDGQVRLYNPAFYDARLPVPQAAYRIGPPAGGIRQVAYSPDGRHLALANGDGTVFVLRLQPRQSQ